ncbi:efflux RND transporter periplasmic adaptor subunit [Luteimonas sp. 100069]|uniref:efflux RND transporter periplasmic adaptor subunit n=1 Tax=Luteimonas sp. 100069 TaxID=2006109 RepID=UPI000F4FE7CA|nr:efflux RND transporter periplasmic adaptor subunit [Luteimonas sp. 100069]RPD84407.1 efflux RND transporter periplasmic adaptor subunit [Luteimonas sp. 100069]
MSKSTKPRRRAVPRFVPVLLIAAVAAGGMWWWSQRTAAGGEDAWRTTPVERGDIRVVISATGTLSATSTVTVGSQVSGQITEVLVDFNDTVEQGQVLARIDPATYQAQIEQGSAQINSARAALAQAQAALRNAELDYERKTALAGQQLVARSDVDLARTALEQARAQVRSAQAQIVQQTASTQTSRINMERTVIRSPVDGTILTRSIEPGQTVAASLQAPELFTIAEDLRKMRIELAVDEADIGQVQVGQAVTFTSDAFNDRRFSGTVEQVRLAATTTNNVVTYPVVVAVDNADGTLLPGLTVNAEIEVSNRENVLKVANAALRYRPADAADIPAAQPAGGSAPRGGGLADDLAAAAAAMQLDARQQAAFDSALATMRESQQAARPSGQGGQGGGGRSGGMPAGGPPPGMPPGGSARSDPGVQAQIRQRMMDRFQQTFAEFTATLDATQRAQWNRTLAATVGATRVTIYRLVGGRREAVPVRLGASDGSATEIAGAVAEGDLIVTGERAAAR